MAIAPMCHLINLLHLVESPASNHLLAYRSEHYMRKRAHLDSRRLQVNLSLYLDKLEQKDYPYDRTAIQFPAM
jgi:hypothetical protein